MQWKYMYMLRCDTKLRWPTRRRSNTRQVSQEKMSILKVHQCCLHDIAIEIRELTLLTSAFVSLKLFSGSDGQRYSSVNPLLSIRIVNHHILLSSSRWLQLTQNFEEASNWMCAKHGTTLYQFQCTATCRPTTHNTQ